jgi:class 3 adenylate cyclase
MLNCMPHRDVGQDIGDWLDSLGLGKYRAIFADHDIDADVLGDLTEADLERLGISIGHRKKLLRAIAAAGRRATPAVQNREGERRQLTVMFCDLVGSTALTASIDPEEMRDIVGRYYRAIADSAARFGGFISRYLGDGALVYFGWPQADEADAERAVRAGLELVEAVHAIDAGQHQLQVRVGIATGLVVIGDSIGAGAAGEVAVGDTLNLAARLQTVALPDSVVIADATRRLVGQLFDVEATEPLDLKGIPDPTIAWRIRGERAVHSRFAAAQGDQRAGLVDREAETALLLEHWRTASGGRGCAVVLVGEAGNGKSRVVQDLFDRLAGQPHQRGLFQCSPLHANTALYPAIRHLEQAVGLLADDQPGQHLDKLTARVRDLGMDPAAIPLLAGLLSLPGAADSLPIAPNPRQHRVRLIGALTDHLAMLARRQPLVLLVEDAHWVDPTTLELVEALIERIEQLPLLLIVTTRPDLVPIAARAGTCTVHTMQRLEPADADRLLQQVVGNKRLPPGLAEQVLSRTDGVPLFIEELTHSLLESGLLVERGGEWKPVGRLERLAIPTTLRDSLMSRLDRIGPSKEIAQLGAVLGREFAVALLAAVAEADAARLAGHLDRLVEARLLSRGAEGSYSFRHALIQDAAYESLLLSRRRQLHARVASVLERRFPQIAETQPELVAYHHTAAGQPDPAVAWWQRAAEYDLRRSANLEAIEHCNRALELLPLLPPEPARDAFELDIRIQLGVAFSGTHGYTAPEWEANTARLLALAERGAGAGPNLIPVLWHEWVGVFSAADMDRALRLARRMFAFAERSGERTSLMVGHRVLGMSLVGGGQVALACSHLGQALVLHDAELDAPLAYVYAVDQRLSTMGYLSLALIQCGYPDQGRRVSDDARADALRRNLSNTTGFTLSMRLGAHILCRDSAALRSTAEELLALARHHRLRGREVLANTVLALLEARDTGAAAVLAAAHRGSDELDALNWRFWIPWLLFAAAEIRLERGENTEAASALLDRGAALVESTGYGLCAPELARLRARLLAAKDQGGEAAAAQFRHAIELARGQGARLPALRAATELAQLWLDSGERERALSLLEPIVASFTEGFATTDLREAKAVLALLQ